MASGVGVSDGDGDGVGVGVGGTEALLLEDPSRFDLCCAVCLEEMDWERLPRVLPCSHSFCSDCLRKVTVPFSSSSSSSSSSSDPSSYGTGKNCRCPICRTVFECVSVESFDVSHSIAETVSHLVSSDLVSLFPNFSDEKNKRECVNFKNCGGKTSMHCPKCEKFICDSCDVAHTSSIFARDHKRQEYQSNDHTGNSTLYCSEQGHSSEVANAFCFECSSFVCVQCIYGSHSQHHQEIRPIKESVRKRQKEVMETGNKLERKLKKMKWTKERIESRVGYLERELAKERTEEKELDLEMSEVIMKLDALKRLSKTPKGHSILHKKVFSTLLQTAADLTLLNEDWVPPSLKPPGVVCFGGVKFAFSFQFNQGPFEPSGMCINCDGNYVVADRSAKRVRIFRREGSLVESLGSDEIFWGPIDVSIGVNHQIVVVDILKHCVVIFDKDGYFLNSFGSKGSQPGQFSSPSSVVVDKEGRIIVVDRGNNRLQVFKRDGTFIQVVRGGNLSINGTGCIAIDEDGHLVISDYENSAIRIVNLEGQLIRSITPPKPPNSTAFAHRTGPMGVAVDGKGRIVVVLQVTKQICVLEKNGKHFFFGDFSAPWGVVVDCDGSVIVSDRGVASKKRCVDSASIQVWK